MLKRPQARVLTVLFLLALPLLVFHRALFLGEAFLPADLLQALYPWKALASAPGVEQVIWNVLRFDGITEFYPWRRMAAEAFQQGRIPLWNPYAFAASGGTPLLANSQSALFYPLNLVFWLFPLQAFWYAFGLSAALHLFLAAKGMSLFLRAVGVGRMAALLGATAFSLSAPVITWLALPTFLAVSCWIPWLLLFIHRGFHHSRQPGRRGAVALAGVAAGLMLLAGHLQMAFYGLLAGLLYALALGIRGLRQGEVKPLPWLTALIGALALGGMLAAPQVLPALELSRTSHRASGPPSMETYQGYIANALPLQSLTTLIAPDFFGHPNQDNGLYLNFSAAGRPNNYAEWALYTGVAPLALALFALALPWRGSSLPPERGFLAVLALFALLLSLGSPLNLPFFFLVPGYSQTGNPARSLILFAFAVAGLAAIGLHALRADDVSREAKLRAALAALVVPLLLLALGVNAAAGMAARVLTPAGIPFSALLARAMPGLLLGLVLLAFAVAALFLIPRLKPEQRSPGAALLLLLTLGDLFAWGYGYNPTTPSARVYPETPGIAWLKTNAKDALLAPINRGWSLSGEAPRDAVLPPNTLAAYGLHDVAGYDSLFPGIYKERARAAHDGADPSPPENGNMVFTKTVEAAKELGAKYILTPPGGPDLSPLGLSQPYSGADMTIYYNPAGRDFDPSPARAYAPLPFQIGLVLQLVALLGLAAFLAANRPRKKGSSAPASGD